MSKSYDYILVGGGLQNGLITLALLDAHPDVSIALVERAETLGGNHTWCFHSQDVPPTASAFVEPLIRYHWPGYSIAFPNLTRDMPSPYYGATSEQLDRVVSSRLAAAPGCDLFLGRGATEVKGQLVTLDDGTTIPGQVVIDSRGPDEDVPDTAYQKFAGLEVELAEPHALVQPWLMDATVPQSDGFRFFYVLPLSPTRLLIEDTYFSDTTDLDMPSLRAGIEAYARSRGYHIAEVIREERGVLPLPWNGDVIAATASPLIAGYRGGWFHPATGYSFPVAVRLAEFVANTPITQLFGSRLQKLADEQRRQIRFCHKLNKMLFRWFHPEQRWNVFERFYKLPEPLIRRFYSLNMTARDRARILIGRPPRGLSIRAGLARRSL